MEPHVLYTAMVPGALVLVASMFSVEFGLSIALLRQHGIEPDDGNAQAA